MTFQSAEKKYAASLGFNATLPDALYGLNLFTHSVLYHEGQLRSHWTAAAEGCRRPACPDGYDLLSGKQSRAADAGRSRR
jgi:hypothetical protein